MITTGVRRPASCAVPAVASDHEPSPAWRGAYPGTARVPGRAYRAVVRPRRRGGHHAPVPRHRLRHRHRRRAGRGPPSTTRATSWARPSSSWRSPKRAARRSRLVFSATWSCSDAPIPTPTDDDRHADYVLVEPPPRPEHSLSAATVLLAEATAPPPTIPRRPGLRHRPAPSAASCNGSGGACTAPAALPGLADGDRRDGRVRPPSGVLTDSAETGRRAPANARWSIPARSSRPRPNSPRASPTRPGRRRSCRPAGCSRAAASCTTWTT